MSESLHIVELPSFFPPDGGEFCMEQSQALARRGHRVSVLVEQHVSLRKHPRDFFRLPKDGVPVQYGAVTAYLSRHRSIPKCVGWNMNRWVRALCRQFDRYEELHGKPDILHAHCAKWAGYAAMLISQKHGIPYVVTEHLPSMIFREEFREDSGAWQIPLIREAYRQAAMVVPVSEELVEDLRPLFGTDYTWRSISNTIDTDFFSYRERSKLSGRNFKFCALGNFIPRKGYDVLFEAFSLLLERQLQAELHIAGRDTDGDSCLRMLRELVPQGRVYVHGELGKHGVRDLLYQTDALVLASRSESQGLVLLEAMSTGMPTVSTEAIPRSIRIDGGTLIVPTDDASQLAEAMLQVVHQSDFDGAEVSDKVRKMASPEVIGKQLEELFVEIAQR